MIKNTYPTTSTSSTNLLPHPNVLQFLKMYSSSLDVVKGKKTVVL